ncbi:MAG: agmatinase [Thermovirgaceae bacterium]
MTRFLGSKGRLCGADWIILGAPLDLTVSRLSGSRRGPEAIREESGHLETYSINAGRDLEEVSFMDIGNILLDGRDLAESLDIIRLVAQRFFDLGKRLFTFGGEHLATLPLVEAATERYPDLRVVHFDAHADLRDTYHGAKLTHATVMRRVAEGCLESPKNLYQFGIRSATAQEHAWGRERTNLIEGRIPEALENVQGLLQGHPVYVSIDIDVVDPGFAPGTGTPEPGGIGPGELFEAVEILGRLDIIGADIVEVSPLLDINGITAGLAAKICREGLLFWGR